MTDAAASVTQSAVERFTERYLESLGGTIEKRGHRWNVVIPEDADTDLLTGSTTLVCEDVGEIAKEEVALHPESSFFQAVLDEASNRVPVGRVTIDANSAEIAIPDFLRESDIVVNDAQFVPYYDRTAIVALFLVSVETVSEYQQEFLRTVAIDTRTGEVLSNLDEAFLRLTDPEKCLDETTDFTIGRKQIERLIESTRDTLVSEMQLRIDEIHREASRAADSELEEYRQMQQQREEELEEERTSLRSRIDELSEIINEGSQESRVEALKDRREYRSEYDAVESELTELRERRDRGFPEKQQEIRERHAVEVTVVPRTVTEVAYESGEIEFELAERGNAYTLTTGYGSGVGVTEEVHCVACEHVLSEQKPLGAIAEEILCIECTTGIN